MAIAEPAASLAPARPDHRLLPGEDAQVRGVTLEQLAYVGLMLLALFAHLWQLGARALHHDETLHAYYSWLLYTGQGYVHDPLLHGPFLYFQGAFWYLLFNDSDTTARIGAALFGTALVGMPYLVRRELGRGAALLAACYLLFSPAFLYVGRFIRHDIFAVTFEMLTFIGVVRYGSTRQPRYLYLAAASFGFMVTTMETSYLYSVIFLPVLGVLFLWRVWKPGLALIAVLGVALITLVFVLPGQAKKDGNNNALRDPAGRMEYTPGPLFGWYPLETDDNNFALRIRNRPDDNLAAYLTDLGPFFAHPGVLSALGLTLAALAGIGLAIWARRGTDGLTAWTRARGRPDAVLDTFASLAVGNRVWWALGLFFLIYGLFYSSFLTNVLGLLTGTTGSLLYWLAQHDVRRGGQPSYYYLVLMAVYEPLLMLWGLIGFALALGVVWRAFRRVPDSLALPDNWRLVLVLAWWSLAALGLYSWAGEKMPWLTIHIWLPWTLLASWAMARVLPRLLHVSIDEVPRIEWQRLGLYLAAFGVVVGLSFVLLAVYGNTEGSGGQLNGLVLLVLVALVAVLTVITALVQGWRWSLGGLLLGFSLVMTVYTVRSTVQLNYHYGDTPREMLIFVQTSPDVARVINRLETVSRKQTGRLDLPVIYDNETVWQWYLRDFRKATNTGPTLQGRPGPEVMAVLMLQENLSPENRAALEGFVMQRYPLRWWFPEEAAYRLSPDWATSDPQKLSLLGRLLRIPSEPRTLTDLWQYLIYRAPPGPLGSTDFVIAVRPELARDIGLGTGAGQGVP